MASRALDLERDVLRILDERGVVSEVVCRDHHSNEVLEIRFEDGRVLVVKRAPDPRLSRFHVSRRAARLARRHTRLHVPEYLDLPGLPDVLAYWWLPWPTLASLWRDRHDRRGLARSWGRRLGELHAIRLDGHGPLDGRRGGLRDWLDRDLRRRLAPAVGHAWPAARDLVTALAAHVTALPEPPPTLVHNDLFDRNVLCDPLRDEVVGMIDFEDAFAGPPEADVAKTELVHGPLFRDPLDGDWFDALLEGWGRAPDPALVSFFRAWNLVNMGYHASLQGFVDHVGALHRALRAELDAFASGRRHRAVVAR